MVLPVGEAVEHPLEGRLVLADGTAIPIEDILGIQDGSGDRLFGEETL